MIGRNGAFRRRVDIYKAWLRGEISLSATIHAPELLQAVQELLDEAVLREPLDG